MFFANPDVFHGLENRDRRRCGPAFLCIATHWLVDLAVRFKLTAEIRPFPRFHVSTDTKQHHRWKGRRVRSTKGNTTVATSATLVRVDKSGLTAMFRITEVEARAFLTFSCTADSQHHRTPGAKGSEYESFSYPGSAQFQLWCGKVDGAYWRMEGWWMKWRERRCSGFLPPMTFGRFPCPFPGLNF